MAREFLFLAILFAAAVHAHADEPAKIPLIDIWAYDIPETTEVSEKEEKPKNPTAEEWLRFNRESLVNQIYVGLGNRKRGQPADNAFCVAGTGLDALKAAHAVLVKQEQLQKEFPSDIDVTLVFFAHSSGKNVRLVDVERDGTSIQVRYLFKAHMELNLTKHFALIPLGKLKPGKYQVKFVQMPIESDEPPDHRQVGQLESDERVSQIIAKPFNFRVVEK